MKVDRRVDKTRGALRNALYELVHEKSYESITVAELIDRASVARSSFYAHFRDKDDLLLSGLQDIGITSSDDMFEIGEGDSAYPDFARVLFQGASRHPGMSRAFLTMESNTVASIHMRNMLVVRTRSWLRQQSGSQRLDSVEPVVQYLVSALMGLLIWWVHSDFPHSPETMADIFKQLAVSGLEGSLPAVSAIIESRDELPEIR
jgi:AcrR family transcriptional regulator